MSVAAAAARAKVPTNRTVVLSLPRVWVYALLATTLAISTHNVRVELGLESALCGLAALSVARCRVGPAWPQFVWLAGSVLGMFQLTLGASHDKGATVEVVMRFTAMAACASVPWGLKIERSPVESLNIAAFDDAPLDLIAGGATTLAVVSVLARYSSPYKLLWLVPSAYPDIWGPFESSSNFAEWIELVFPVALYRMARRKSWESAIPPATLFAAGLASGSRMGAALLLGECLAFIPMIWRASRRAVPAFLVAATLLGAAAGGDLALRRLSSPSPLRYRTEIWLSSLAAIRARPIAGWGLGAFESVYPRYAQFDTGERVEHAHNDYLEWAVEGGVPLYVLLGGTLIALGALSLRRPWTIGLTAVAVHALVDDPFVRIGIGAWYSVLATFLVRGIDSPGD